MFDLILDTTKHASRHYQNISVRQSKVRQPTTLEKTAFLTRGMVIKIVDTSLRIS